MMQLGTKYIGLGPGDIVLDGDPAPPKERGHSSYSPTFRPMSIVAKRSPSQQLLSSCEICERTDRQTYRHAHRNTSHPYRGGGEVTILILRI